MLVQEQPVWVEHQPQTSEIATLVQAAYAVVSALSLSYEARNGLAPYAAAHEPTPTEQSQVTQWLTILQS